MALALVASGQAKLVGGKAVITAPTDATAVVCSPTPHRVD
jgi:hypothetical protein